jgi:hypothetical protein
MAALGGAMEPERGPAGVARRAVPGLDQPGEAILRLRQALLRGAKDA